MTTPSSPLRPALPVRSGERQYWTHLYGSAGALAISAAARQHGGPVVVIAENPRSAERLEEEVRFFLSQDPSLPLLPFPDWETLPYDNFSPHQDITSDRLRTLYRLPALTRGILIVPVTTLMLRLPPPTFLESNALMLDSGQALDLDRMRERLDAAGYRCVGQVVEHGEFAVRGSLLDLFPMGSRSPYRIDLLDDQVDSIRTFDPETQRSREAVQTVRLLPAREFPTTEEATARFRRRWRAQFEGDPTASPVYRDVSRGILPPGIEYYLPLFFEQTADLFQYLPDNALLMWEDGVPDAAQACWRDVSERFQQRQAFRDWPPLPVATVFLPVEELFAGLRRYPQAVIGGLDSTRPKQQQVFASRTPLSLPIDGRATEPLGPLQGFLRDFGGRVLFAAETRGRREVLVDTFRHHAIEPRAFATWADFLAGDSKVAITVDPIERGAVLEDPAVALITESQLFGKHAVQSRRRKRRGRDAESVLRDLTELKLDEPVVHAHHGVGRYRGLETLTTGGLTNEFLTLEYADGDRLYVPVSSLHLISRYTGIDAEAAPLHKLGTAQWEKARRKAAERARDVAAELLEVQARRAARPGHPFPIEEAVQRCFAEGFRFEETPDQQAAIDDAFADMASDKPMDRLVCGDVGFGKTEVAIRAAFVAVQGGMQVAILVPTTLLAQQHYENFCDRFADWAVRVELLSRFRSKKQQSELVAALNTGTVDIVIGTHKLLQAEIRFKRLGLVIIDEEHRFGVGQKERLKALRARVDVLTLTATPIPRTLNMALSGMRDLSLIATPPERRLSIKTFVRQWDAGLLREACLREIKRGGQVYFVHNRIEDIAELARKVEALVPEATLRVAHGQLRERELEQVMLEFYHRRFNLLVCTTIIESGIDVPSANTIIINRADRFGLAQLHQLRGRVGRSHHRAYAYLVVPPRAAMTADAVKRLEAIESLEELGIGFSLATHDLEIRGAGELLGQEQSGQIQAVGYALYTQLLERAIEALRSGRSPDLDRPLDTGTEVDLRAPALIPEEYLPDVHVRLLMYKRIASADSADDLRDLQVEMIDRFGILPAPTQLLFRLTELKLRATQLGIRKIELGPRGGRLMFEAEPKVNAERLVSLLQREPQTFRFEGKDKLRVAMDLPDAQARLSALERVLDNLETRDAA